MDSLVFVIVWSIGLGAFFMWFYNKLNNKD
jgi:hypothetical protein